MTRRIISVCHSQRGMSLVEILVGLAIGMVGVLVIFETMAVWGGRTATTISGGDARTTGAIAMYYLERDLRQGGLGFGITNAASRQFQPGCEIGTGANMFLFSAAEITSGTAGASDSVTVLYANSSNLNVNFSDIALFTQDKSSASNFYSYQGPALAKDDWVVLANGAKCELTRVSSSTQTLNQITFNSPVTVTQGNLMNLGNMPQRATWSIVDGNRLVRTESIFSNVVSDVADGVVDLQAQYGFADNTWKTTVPTSAQWMLLRAVKVAILVRSKQFEKPENGAVVTPVAPVWRDGSGSEISFLMKNIDGSIGASATCPCSPDTNDWRQYRYEVFERLIPLRNLIWGAQL